MSISPLNDISILHRRGWLSQCPNDIQDALSDMITVISLDAGATLFHAGDPPGGVYGVASGCIALESAQADHAPRLGTLMHPGTWFGEGILAGRTTRLVEARTSRPSTLAVIKIQAFLRLAQTRPEIWRYIAQLAIENTERAVNLIEDMTIRNSDTRLAAILVRLAGLRETCPPDPAIIDANQSDIAARANLSRSVVSPKLRELERQGLIELGRSSVRVANPSGLLAKISVP